VAQVAREVDGRHSAAPELALDEVSIGQRRFKAIQDIGHEAESIRCGSERQRLDRHAANWAARDDCSLTMLPPYRLTALPPYLLPHSRAFRAAQGLSL